MCMNVCVCVRIECVSTLLKINTFERLPVGRIAKYMRLMNLCCLCRRSFECGRVSVSA